MIGNFWIEVPEFRYNFQVDGKTIEIKSVDIDAKIGMEPIKVQF